MKHSKDTCPDDNVLAAYVDGAVTDERRQEVEAHLSRCPDCRVLVTDLAFDLEEPPASDHGDSVHDRYRLESLVGRGAMGAVYRAYDANLDRTIALKFLQPRVDAQTQDPAPIPADSLQREAHALAKLTHPNVVTVYELGVLDGQSFAAMELVEGKTLAQAVHRRQLRWRAVVALLVQAGRGLAAAHRAGVIHRDVKPSNLLVGADGRVRVVDFGLASTQANPNVGASTPSSDTRAALAVTSLAGTPAYMAPEVDEGERANELSDQYSFSITAVELLTGERPRRAPGSTLVGWDDRGLPRRLRAILRRGLAVAPEQRHPDMTAMTDALAACIEPRRPWFALAMVTTTLAALAGVYALAGPEPKPPQCNAGDAQVAAIWSPEKRQALITALDERFGRSVLTVNIADELDRYAEAWALARREACLDTQVRGVQSSEIFDRRMLCLDQELAYVEAYVNALPQLDKKSITTAAEVAAQLASPSTCSSRESLLELADLPPDKAERAMIRELSEKVEAYKSWFDLGRLAEAETALAELEPAVLAHGYDPLLANFFLRKADIAIEQEDLAEAQDLLHRALQHAEAGGDLVRKIHATTALGGVAGLRGQHGDATRWIELARATTRRAGLSDDTELSGNFATILGSIAWERGEYDEALELFTEALDLRSSDPKTSPFDLLGTQNNLAMVNRQLGRFDEAAAHVQRALEVSEALYGPDSAITAESYFQLGNLHQSTGKPELALEHAQKAAEILAEEYGDRSPKTISSQINVGVALLSLGRFEETQRVFSAAVAALEESGSPDTDQHATLLLNLANLEYRQGHFAEALDFGERAVDLLQAAFGPDHPSLADPLSMIGTAQVELERWEKAKANLTRALALHTKSLGAEHPHLAYTENSLADIELYQGRYAEAHRRYAEVERLAGDDFVRSAAKLGQSKALWKMSPKREKRRKQARQLASEARRLYQGSEQVDPQFAELLRQWQDTVGIS